MILDLPPNIEQIIITHAQEQGVSAEEWITNIINTHTKSMTVAEYFLQTKPLASFKDIDPLTYQKAVRDEWD